MSCEHHYSKTLKDKKWINDAKNYFPGNFVLADTSVEFSGRGGEFSFMYELEQLNTTPYIIWQK